MFQEESTSHTTPTPLSNGEGMCSLSRLIGWPGQKKGKTRESRLCQGLYLIEMVCWLLKSCWTKWNRKERTGEGRRTEGYLLSYTRHCLLRLQFYWHQKSGSSNCGWLKEFLSIPLGFTFHEHHIFCNQAQLSVLVVYIGIKPLSPHVSLFELGIELIYGNMWIHWMRWKAA